jgi:hypothetical protein
MRDAKVALPNYDRHDFDALVLLGPVALLLSLPVRVGQSHLLVRKPAIGADAEREVKSRVFPLREDIWHFHRLFSHPDLATK